MVFWRKLSLLVFFSPILYGLLIILQLTNEKNYPARNLARHFGILHYSSGLTKVTELIRYSQAVNVAFIKHSYILIYIFIYIIYIATCTYLYIHTMLHILCIVAFIMFLCFSKFNLFTLNFCRCFWYYVDNHLFKKALQLKNLCWKSFWVNLWLILVVYLY